MAILLSIAVLNLLCSLVVVWRLRQPTSPILWVMKAVVSAKSWQLFLLSLFVLSFGWIWQSLWTVFLSAFSILLYLVHMRNITSGPDPDTGFQQAFTESGLSRIGELKSASFFKRRVMLRFPSSPDPTVKKNIAYHTYEDSSQGLLCDLWQPHSDVSPSGTTFIYLHGSAWTVWDKGAGTDRLFRHLCSQGHVVMDVAYRLFPETDFLGMVHDTKHSIAWIKSQPKELEIETQRIILGGGSAGGHLALLTAYTTDNSAFTPEDLQMSDLGVQAVISLCRLRVEK